MRRAVFLLAIAALPALAVLATERASARGPFAPHPPLVTVPSGLGRHLSQLGGCSVFSRHSCYPTVCSVFLREPCIPAVQFFGDTLQLTIVSEGSTDKVASTEGATRPDNDQAANNQAPEAGHAVDTIRDVFDALRACWVPPPQEQARAGMQMSVRFSFKRDGEIIDRPRVTYATSEAPAATRDVYHDAITAALDHCTPLPFTDGLGGAIAGHPIAIRFVDNRKPD
jgi:hypothetical protein